MSVLGLFQQLRAQEIIIILVVLLVLFGAKKLPDIGKGLGKGIREFRDASKGLADDVEAGMRGDDELPAGTKDGSAEQRPSNE